MKNNIYDNPAEQEAYEHGRIVGATKASFAYLIVWLIIAAILFLIFHTL
jgi:hypothetical protein